MMTVKSFDGRNVTLSMEGMNEEIRIKEGDKIGFGFMDTAQENVETLQEDPESMDVHLMECRWMHQDQYKDVRFTLYSKSKGWVTLSTANITDVAKGDGFYMFLAEAVTLQSNEPSKMPRLKKIQSNWQRQG